MAIGWQEHLRPGVELRSIVQQATAALIAMDAERLEELALCCADLNREDRQRDTAEMREPNSFAGVRDEMDLFGGILRETRANLTVLSRLHAIRLRATFFPPDWSSDNRQEAESELFGVWSRGERRPEYGDN